MTTERTPREPLAVTQQREAEYRADVARMAESVESTAEYTATTWNDTNEDDFSDEDDDTEYCAQCGDPMQSPNSPDNQERYTVDADGEAHNLCRACWLDADPADLGQFIVSVWQRSYNVENIENAQDIASYSAGGRNVIQTAIDHAHAANQAAREAAAMLERLHDYTTDGNTLAQQIIEDAADLAGYEPENGPSVIRTHLADLMQASDVYALAGRVLSHEGVIRLYDKYKAGIIEAIQVYTDATGERTRDALRHAMTTEYGRGDGYSDYDTNHAVWCGRLLVLATQITAGELHSLVEGSDD